MLIATMVLLSVRVFSSISSSRWLAIVHPVATSVTVKVQTEWCGREGQVVLCNECDVSSVVGFADAAADVAVSAAVDSVVLLPLPLWASQYQASPSPSRSENKTMTVPIDSCFHLRVDQQRLLPLLSSCSHERSGD